MIPTHYKTSPDVTFGKTSPDVTFGKTINSFSDIIVNPSTLIVLDIDETTIRFHETDYAWRDDHYTNFLQIHSDHDIARELAHQMWRNRIPVMQAYHSDHSGCGIEELMSRARSTNSHIIFLTARDDTLADATYQHLKDLGIGDIEVNFCAGRNKGTVLVEILKEFRTMYQNIIFVDDRLKHLEEVYDAVNQTVNLTLYQFDINVRKIVE
jgi:hypothetical protein